jgi:hypothetical protein
LYLLTLIHTHTYAQMFAYQLSSLVPAFKFLTSMTEEFKTNVKPNQNINKKDFIQYLDDFKYACNEAVQIILLKLNDKMSDNTQCYLSGFDLDKWVPDWHKVFVSLGESAKFQIKELDILHYSIRKLDLIYIKLNMYGRENMSGIKEFVDVFSTVRYIIYNEDEDIDTDLKSLEYTINRYNKLNKPLESPRDLFDDYLMENDSIIWEDNEWDNKTEEEMKDELDIELFDMLRERENYFLAKDAIENKKNMLINIGGEQPCYIQPLLLGKHHMGYIRCVTNRPEFYSRLLHTKKQDDIRVNQKAELEHIQLDYFDYIASY